MPLNYEVTETALKVLCNVVSHDAFHSAIKRGIDCCSVCLHVFCF